MQQIYTNIANNAERDLTLDDIELTLDALIGVKLSAYTERKLQACVEEVLIESPGSEMGFAEIGEVTSGARLMSKLEPTGH